MAKSRPNNGPQELLNRINDRFPNFLLGLTVFVLVILIGSLFLQNKELSSLKLPASITKIFGGDKNVQPEQSVKSYTIKNGDTLWSIAEEAYGSGYNAYDIAQANKIVDPNLLVEGVVIELPAMEPKDPTRGEVTSGAFTTSQETPQTTTLTPETTQPTPKTYTIVAGDSLWSISMKVYGNPYRWTDVWKANPSIVNPDLIYAGGSLALP